MKELVFRARCDLCETESVFPLDSPGDTGLTMDFPLTVGTVSVVLDLCSTHRDEVIGAAKDYLKVGRPPEQPEKAAPKRRQKRTPPLANPVEGYSTDPQAPYTVNPDGTFQCPNCPKTSPRLHGLGAHRRQHGYVGGKAG